LLGRDRGGEHRECAGKVRHILERCSADDVGKLAGCAPSRPKTTIRVLKSLRGIGACPRPVVSVSSAGTL
jgi:hypothetical protein